jgi:hypothetical protein
MARCPSSPSNQLMRRAPASHSPSGAPMAVPRIGMPAKNSTRPCLVKRRIRAGPPISWPAISNRAWMMEPTTSVTIRFLPNQ